MPRNNATREKTSLSPIEDSGHEKYSRKRSKVLLPYRTQEDGGQRRKLARHTNVIRSRDVVQALIKPTFPPVQYPFEQENSDEDVEQIGRPRPAGSPPHFVRQGTVSGHLAFKAYRDSSQRLKIARLNSGPYALLGPGEGDPFFTLPSDLPKDFVDERMHALRNVLPSLVSKSSAGETYGKSFAMDILSPITTNPALFYATMFTEMIHGRVLKGLDRGPAIELEVGTKAIQHISREMRDPKRATLDSNLWVVLILGYSGREAPRRAGVRHPRQSFLKELQHIHVFGKMEIVMEHVLGLIKLVELVGGVQNIKTPGIGQTISFGGLLGACRLLQRPLFPFMAHTGIYLAEGRLPVSDQERKWVLPTIGRLGSGFLEGLVPSTTPEVDELLMVIQHMCDFTIIVENYVEGRWVPKTSTVIIDQRNFVQHSLMSLKTKQELDDSDTIIDEPLYECTRLAAIVYSFLVVFPVPPVAGPFEGLSEQLKVELMTIVLPNQIVPWSELLLWTLVMGGIAAIGLPIRRWFISQITLLSAQLGIEDWEAMRDVLQTFLWLPRTSDLDGRDLWAEIHTKIPV